MSQRTFPLLAFVFTHICSSAFATNYTFSKVVVSGAAILQNYAINDEGEVAYVDAPTGSTELYLKSGGTATKLLDTSGPYSKVVASSVNNQGVVAFIGTLKTGGAVVGTVSASSGVNVVAQNVFETTANPQINDRGEVTYQAGDKSIKIYSNGATQTLVSSSQTLLATVGHLNQNGSVAYAAWNSQYGVFALSSSGQVLISQYPPTALLPASPSINDSGVVAFPGRENSQAVIFSGSGGAVTKIAAADGSAPNGELSPVSINNAGTVAFYSLTTSAAVQIFAGTAPTASKVVATGDSVFGGSVVPVLPAQQKGRILNNSGQIVFGYRLLSGEGGLAIATPDSVVSGGGPTGGSMVVSNGASFDSTLPIAQDSIATIKGTGLATATQSAANGPVNSLGGTSLILTDAAGTARPAALFFVSPGQVNFLVPPGTVPGPATLALTSGSETIVNGQATIVPVSPGIFFLNDLFLAAANVLRVRGGTQTYEPVFYVFDGQILPAGIDLGPPTDLVYLILYGTGLRQASVVTVAVGGANVPTLFSGASSQYPGLDQVNVGPMPRALIGKRYASVTVTADGKPANATGLNFQ